VNRRSPDVCLRAFCLKIARRRVPDLIPRSCGHLCFDCLTSLPRYAAHRSLTDSSAARDDRQEQIGPDVEAAIGDASAADVVLGPNEGGSTGNVTGGRKLARYDFGRRAIKLLPPARIAPCVRNAGMQSDSPGCNLPHKM
jgi:hypothetical protein